MHLGSNPMPPPTHTVGPMRSRIRLSCGRVPENDKGDSGQHIEGQEKREKSESHKEHEDVNVRLLTTHELVNTKGMGTPKALDFPNCAPTVCILKVEAKSQTNTCWM